MRVGPKKKAKVVVTKAYIGGFYWKCDNCIFIADLQFLLKNYTQLISYEIAEEYIFIMLW